MNASQKQREACLKTAGSFFDAAGLHAESGNVREAAVLILKALEQERKATTIGPQVLQLIKPRE